MEHADVPAAAHAVQELHQRARPLGELEAVDDLVLGRRRVPTDEMAHVQLRHLVVGQVVCLDAASLELGEQFRRLVAAGDLDADEKVRDLRIRVAVVELGHLALAEQRAELAEAAGPLGDRHREDRLALLADLGALGDEAQPVEVHVRAACDRRVRAPARAMALDPCLDAGDRERARRLEDRARVLEHVLQRRARGVGVDANDFIDVLACEAKRLLADLLHRDAVGEKPDVRELHAPPRLERARHRVGILRLHADDADLRAHALDIRGDAGDQAAAADRDEDRVEIALPLAQQLHADRALTGDHIGIVVRMHERRLRPALQLERMRVGVAVRIAVQHHLRAARGDRSDLDLRRGDGHHDRRLAAERLRGERDTLRVIAGGGRDDAVRALGRAQMRHLVVGAAQLEREHRLLILALEQHAVAEPPRQVRRELERRLDRDVVDLRGQDLLQIIDRHGMRSVAKPAERSRNGGPRGVFCYARVMPRLSAPQTLAVVDMGSNSFRLEVGRVEGNQIFRLDTQRETLRIGAAIDERGNLTAEARRAALACLARFGERLAGLHPSAVRAVATNTFRVAKNAGPFLAQAERTLGFPIDVITGHEEARLIYAGVAHVLPATSEPRLVIDIGGGSTEFIIGRDLEPTNLDSLKIGCVGMSQRFFADGALTAAAFDAAETAARSEIEAIARDFGHPHWRDAYASSGTALALAEILEQNGFSAGGVTPEGLARLKRRLIAAGHIKRVRLAARKPDAAATQRLEWAARLHETGFSVSHTGFHKHGAYILQHADMPGFSANEQRELSWLVLGCRGGLDKMSAALSDPTFRAQLAALRLAVLFHHARRPIDAPRLSLAVGVRIRFGVPARWLRAHPLTAHLLA